MINILLAVVFFFLPVWPSRRIEEHSETRMSKRRRRAFWRWKGIVSFLRFEGAWVMQADHRDSLSS
jgi:hypothetical protein